MRRSVVTIPFLVLLAAPVSAQVAFDAPSLIGPASPNGLAIYLTNSDPGDGLVGSSTWRGSRGRVDEGCRTSVGEGGRRRPGARRRHRHLWGAQSGSGGLGHRHSLMDGRRRGHR